MDGASGGQGFNMTAAPPVGGQRSSETKSIFRVARTDAPGEFLGLATWQPQAEQPATVDGGRCKHRFLGRPPVHLKSDYRLREQGMYRSSWVSSAICA
jgi:hypothetical protein